MAAERVKFTFPPDLVNTPVIYNMGKEFGVVTNIRRANLSHDRGWVILEVTDDGIGFTPPPLEGPGATEREEHIGLRGMRERVHLVGGQLRLTSQPGQGTQIVVRVPSDA